MYLDAIEELLAVLPRLCESKPLTELDCRLDRPELRSISVSAQPMFTEDDDRACDASSFSERFHRLYSR
jgi:hypothetical protein